MTVEKRESYSLRMYEPFVAVEVSYQGREEGFDALASYFGGLNAEQITFRESQPTILNYDPDGSKRMQMFVGPTRDGETLAELPQPMMEGCRLVAAGGELCAVYRFEGYITPEVRSFDPCRCAGRRRVPRKLHAAMQHVQVLARPSNSE